PATPADFADMLPPVRYQPPPGPRPQRGPQPGPDPRRAPARPAPANPFAPPGSQAGRPAKSRRPAATAIAARGAAVGPSVVLPVVGALSALALIILLRAGDLARQRVVRQRSARGTRRGDPVLVAASFPWYLVRSLLSCLLLAPFALAAAVVV